MAKRSSKLERATKISGELPGLEMAVRALIEQINRHRAELGNHPLVLIEDGPAIRLPKNMRR